MQQIQVESDPIRQMVSDNLVNGDAQIMGDYGYFIKGECNLPRSLR